MEQVTAEQLEHAVDFLTQRCVDGRSPAALCMPLRPALQTLHDQLAALLHGMVNDTAASYSLMVMGDPGSGKTLLVEQALATVTTHLNPAAPPGLSTSAAESQAALSRRLGVVRLSGLLHQEERVAFQEIARQLCSEFGQQFSKAATFEENLAFLRNMLATLHTQCKAVAFVLDGFEAFAHSGARASAGVGGVAGVGASGCKQLLLYNLLDVLQHSRVQAMVIGLTCSQDVMDSLEKRVRSRFSHRRMLVTGLHTTSELVSKPTGAAAARARAAAGAGTAPAPAGPAFGDTAAGVLQELLTLPVTAARAQPVSSGMITLQQQQQLSAGCRCSTAWVQAHNQAIKAAVLDPSVQALLAQLMFCGVRPRALATAARAALDAWEADTWAAADSLATEWPSHMEVEAQSAAAGFIPECLVLPDSEAGMSEGVGRDGASDGWEGAQDQPEASSHRGHNDRQQQQAQQCTSKHGVTVMQGCGSLQGQGPGQQQAPAACPLLPAHLVAGLQSVLPPSSVGVVGQLSSLQLFLLAGLVRLEDKGQSVVNFEMVWDECRSFHDVRDVLSGFTHGAAWRAFEDLVAQNVCYWVSPGAEAAGRAMRYAGASLSLSAAETSEGMRKHPQCPNGLLRFLDQEA